MTDGRMRVAIVGASGIGKHHAKWWNLERADVCAFAGTSDDSVARAAEGLRALFPFGGRGYTRVEEMLEAEQPDIVDVCSPPACHYDHVCQAIEAGAHVLCEKPFVYRAGVPRSELMDQARDLVRRAESRGVRLGLCAQYSAGAPVFQDLWSARHESASVESFCGRLEVPARGRAADPDRVWADLGPHPLSVLQAVFPGGEIDWEGIETVFKGHDASARFSLRKPDGHTVACEIITRNHEGHAGHVREFSANGCACRLDGVNDEEGVYCTLFRSVDVERREPDLMRLLIRRFGDGQAVMGSQDALRNTDWLLRISDVARQGR